MRSGARSRLARVLLAISRRLPESSTIDIRNHHLITIESTSDRIIQVEQEAGEVLDEEAGPFVLKLFRVVIYETERAALAA
jgi:hypothetical protein